MRTKDELLERLRNLEKWGDHEAAHAEADLALLEYINDEEVKEAYENIKSWYS